MRIKKFERDKALCQYTRQENAIKIFKPEKPVGNYPFCIRLSRIVDSNDPFDIKDIKLTGNNYTRNEERLIRKRLKNTLKIACFSYGYAKSNMADSTLVLDKRPVYIKPRMWALYGGKNGDNSGVCIVFDAEEIQKRFKTLEKDFNIRFGKVKYKDFFDAETVEECINRNKIGFNKTPEDTVDLFIKKTEYNNYFCKDIDWKEESEYRLLCWEKFSNKKTVKYASFGFGVKDVKYVVFGYNAEKNRNMHNLVDILTENNIKMLRFGINDNKPTFLDKSLQDFFT